MIPPRNAVDSYLEGMGRKVDIPFDVDVGKLVEGHHVVVRGIELARPFYVQRWLQEFEAERDKNGPPEHRPAFTSKRLSADDMEVVGTRLTEPQLHYEFIPGLEEREEPDDSFFWYWMLHASDDFGTNYSNDNNGARGPAKGGTATHATRDLGGHIPDSATRLVMEFEPPWSWEPPEPWLRELTIDLVARRVIE